METMKKLKKMMALVLVAVMMMAMGITANAEGEKTISVKTGSKHTYEIFQIFTGTYNEASNKLENLKYGVNAVGTTGNAVSQADMTTLSGLIDNDRVNDQTDITNLLPFVNLESTPVATIGAGQTYSAAVGYYLIRDKSDSPSDKTETQTLYLLQVIDENVEISPKDGTTTSDKEVKDINDSEDEQAGDWQKSADWDIGDKVPFRLTATLPANYTDYKTYHLTFHDTQSDGLTFDSTTVKVYVGDSSTPVDASNYTVKTSDIGDETFQVIFTYDNLTAMNVTNNSVIHVEYESELNSNAKIGGAEGNPNTSNVTFDNNPNSNQDGEEGGETPEKTVIVFTYKTIVNKVDEDNNPLTGAEFTLEKKLKDGTTKSIAVVRLDKDGNAETISGSDTEVTSNATKFSFNGLDDGTYVLTETKTPAGYNTMDPVTFKVEATHTATDGTSAALTKLEGADQTSGEVKLTFTADDTNGTLTTDVVNKSGTVLPSTGGIGTTIFYVIGAILVICAGIILVTRKRMSDVK